MRVTILWTADAADAHGSTTEYHGVTGVQADPGELRLHTEDSNPPTVIDRDYVVAYHRFHDTDED